MKTVLTLQELESKLRSLHLESNSLVERALEQAEKSHGKQKRKEGTPYLEGHVYPVTLSLLECPELQGRITPELVAGALLHDALEDDETINRSEFRSIFGEHVYIIVDALTKPKLENQGSDEEERRNQRNARYLERLKKAPWEAQYIKLADRLHNLSTLHLSDQEQQRRYPGETAKYYLPLAKSLSQYYYNEILAALATNLNM
jgi:GTP pyrophosphokinase